MTYYCTRCKRVHSKGKILSDHKSYDRAIVVEELKFLEKRQEIYKQNKAKSLAAMNAYDKRINRLKEKKADVRRQHSSSVSSWMFRSKTIRELKEKLKKK